MTGLIKASNSRQSLEDQPEDEPVKWTVDFFFLFRLFLPLASLKSELLLVSELLLSFEEEESARLLSSELDSELDFSSELEVVSELLLDSCLKIRTC